MTPCIAAHMASLLEMQMAGNFTQQMC